MALHSFGSPVAHGACPACHRATLYYCLETRRLTCRACPWAVTLSPDEHDDWLFMQIWPDGVIEVAAFLSTLARRVTLVDAPPAERLIGTQDGPFRKWRIVAVDAETPQQRAARLAEQSEVNNVQIRPCNEGLTEWLVSSQRRNAAGEPVTWYRVTITPFTAKCSCAADGLCAHLMRIHTALLDAQQQDRAREVAWNSKSAAQVDADGRAALADLWG